MKLHTLKLHLRFLAFPLLAVLAFAGNSSCKEVSADQEITISPEEAQNQAVKTMGKICLIVIKQLTPEEKKTWRDLIEKGLVRDSAKSLSKGIK